MLPFMPKQPPVILGHEVAGVITEIGEGVTGYELGARIIASGNNDFCPGWTADGGYATHCLLKAESLIPLPDSVSFAQGAAATDAGQTSYSAVMHGAGAGPGVRLGIIGLGGLGMTGARIAVLNGAEVYAAEPRRESWATAKSFGVREVVSDVSELEHLALDVIVDFAGFGVTTAGALKAVRYGGTVVQVGMGRTEATISTGTMVRNALTLRANNGGQPGDTAKVIAHMAKGELSIPTSAISFEEIPEGLERLHRGEVVGRLIAELTAA